MDSLFLWLLGGRHAIHQTEGDNSDIACQLYWNLHSWRVYSKLHAVRWRL